MVTHKYFWMILLMSVTNSRSEKMNINSLVDKILQNAKASILSKNNGQINIPDMEEPFCTKVGFFDVCGGVKATQGIFKNLTTLERTGDATSIRTETGAKVRLLLGLEDMELHFDQCRFWLGISISEKLGVKVNSNSIDGQISVFDDGKTCKATLDHIIFNKFDGFQIEIKLKGLPSIFDKPLESLGGWILNHFKRNIKEAVEKELHEQVSKEMQNYNLCDILDQIHY